MANPIQFFRGLEANRVAETPDDGSPLWTTDDKELFVGDGATGGGVKIGPFTLAQLGYTGDANANEYVHPTTAGNKHIPAAGTVGQILTNSAPGTVIWAPAPDGTTNLGVDSLTNTTLDVTSSTGTDATIPVAVASTSAGLISGTELARLEAMADGANLYVHPTTSGNKHIPIGGSADQILFYNSDGTAVWGDPDFQSDTFRIQDATTSTKEIAFNATAVVGTRTITMPNANINLGDITTNNSKVSNVSTSLTLGTATDATQPINSDGSSPDITLPQAVASTSAGLMSGTDKALLDGMDASANNYDLNVTGDSGTAQVITNAESLNFTGTGLTATMAANEVGYTIDDSAISLAKMADLAANSIIGNNTGSAATPIALNKASSQTLLGIVDVGGGTFTGAVIIQGNLTVSGTTTSINTEELTVNDNIIVLNNNEAGVPSQNAGIEVERGTSPNVSILWNEASDTWTYTNDGTTYKTFINEDAVVLVDGTNALTADWDAGAFEIRALTFESDQATGAAPFVIESTTEVANLNVELHGGYAVEDIPIDGGTF